MKMNTFEEEREYTNPKTGEILRDTKITKRKRSDEPGYIKLYIKDLCKLNDIPKTGNDVLNELLAITDYKNEIVLNGGIKDRILKSLKIKKGSLDNNISKLTKHQIIMRVARGIYTLNPNLFGRGKWEDIKKLRIEWEYSNKGRELKQVKTETHEQTKMDFNEPKAVQEVA